MFPESAELYFSQKFFEETWPKMLCAGKPELSLEGLVNPIERAKVVYESLVPSMDAYVAKYGIPTQRIPGETDEAFYKRVCDAMYVLNEQNKDQKGWKDCWLSTAIDAGRTNCALGSLVLGRALEIAGYSRDDMEFGFPGPMSHAVVIITGKYIDQANGVVADVEQGTTVDGIKTYKVIESGDPDIMNKIPFRRIPVCRMEQGVAPLVWNISSMLRKGDKDAIEMTKRFNIDASHPYSSWARGSFLTENWRESRMREQEEWKEEKRVSEELFKQ